MAEAGSPPFEVGQDGDGSLPWILVDGTKYYGEEAPAGKTGTNSLPDSAMDEIAAYMLTVNTDRGKGDATMWKQTKLAVWKRHLALDYADYYTEVLHPEIGKNATDQYFKDHPTGIGPIDNTVKGFTSFVDFFTNQNGLARIGMFIVGAGLVYVGINGMIKSGTGKSLNARTMSGVSTISKYTPAGRVTNGLT